MLATLRDSLYLRTSDNSMKKTILYSIWCIIYCLGISPAIRAEDQLLMHIDEIRPGMKGIGRTVFTGTQIEEFDVEILGVLKNQTPHGDAIMAKVMGGPLPLEKSGVLAGMSGSPIYIEGRLIGALAFIPSIFPKEPMVAGITPIHEMLRDANRIRPNVEQQQTAFVFPGDGEDSDTKSFKFVPIQTPLIISGIDQRLLPFVEEQVASLNMTPVQGGSTAQADMEDADTDLEPGSAVGVQLLRGDMEISAVGTVTHRDDDKILAFGHPMFFAGNVNFPMTAAYVNLTVSNLINSFKMASSLKTVGTITQDWRTGISGIIGKVSPMIPFDVTVRYNGEQAAALEYTFEVIEHPLYTSLLMKIASLNALLATEKLLGETTIHTKAAISLKGESPLVLEDQFTSRQNPIPGIISAFTPLDTLMRNQFKPIHLEHVSLEISVKESLQLAEIVGVRVRDNVVNPGETLEVYITLRPYGKEQTTVAETITIPEDIRQGTLQLLVCDANVNTAVEAARARATLQPQNFSQLKQLLHDQPSQNHIIMSLLQLKPGAVVQGRELPSPPVSMIALMDSTARSTGKNTLTRGKILTRNYVPTHYVIAGSSALELKVDHTAVADDDVYTDEDDTLKQGENMP